MTEPLTRISRKARRRLLLARLASPLWHLKAWRWLQFHRYRRKCWPTGCTCRFADYEETPVPTSWHPRRDCPKRTSCGGSGTGSAACGGCDQCIEDQWAYYEAKSRGML